MPVRVQRPLTASGIAGLRKPSQTQHEVRDAHYYKSFLALSLQELEAEIARVKSLTVDMKRELANKEIVDLEETVLAAEVNSKKKELYDINAAIDHLRRKDRKFDQISDLQQMGDDIELECERLIAAKQQMEALIIETKKNSAIKQNEWESQLAALDKDTRRQTEILRNQMSIRSKTNGTLRDRHAGLRSEVDQLRASLEADPIRCRKIEAEKSLLAKEIDIQNLDAEIDILNQPLPEQRELILKYVKEMNAEQSVIESEVQKVRVDIDAIQASISDLREHRQDRSEKFDLISVKKREIDEFLERFADQAGRMRAQIATLQGQVLGSAEQLSKFHEKQNAAPEVEFMKKELKQSSFTTNRLEEEIKDRTEELARIDDIESTYLAELSLVNTQISVLELQTTSAGDIAEARRLKEAQAASIEDQLRRMGETKRNLEDGVAGKRNELTRLEERLESDPIHKKLAQVDQRLNSVIKQIDELNSEANQALLVDERKQLTGIITSLNDLIIANMYLQIDACYRKNLRPNVS